MIDTTNQRVAFLNRCVEVVITLRNNSSRNVWENIANDIIPTIPNTQYSNCRFTLCAGNSFSEWNIAKPQIIRMKWRQILEYPDTIGDATRNVVQEIMNYLPGKKNVCQSCQWSLPMTCFYNNTTCCYCNDLGKKYLVCKYGGHFTRTIVKKKPVVITNIMQINDLKI
jgi:hypothetical protein